MCLGGLFGGNDDIVKEMRRQAREARAESAANLAAANLDSESSRTASESRMRRASASRGFADTIFGALGAPPASVAVKQLMGA